MTRLRGIPLDSSPAVFAAYEQRVEAAALDAYLDARENPEDKGNDHRRPHECGPDYDPSCDGCIVLDRDGGGE
jgi:hypothetical protein